MTPKYIWVFLACCAAFLAGCRKDQHSELFEMRYTADFTLPAGLNTVEAHFFTFPGIPSRFDEQLAATGRPPTDIVSITPKYAELSIVFRDEDLKFIRQVFVRIYDPFDPSQRSFEIFYLDPVPNNTRTLIRPFPGLSDVREIATRQVFGIEVGLSLWNVTPRSFDMRLQFDLSANVD